MQRLQSLLTQRADLEKEISSLQRYIAEAPVGKLIARRMPSGKYKYSTKDHKGKRVKEHYISSNDLSTAESLALKEYSEARLKYLQREKRLIDETIRCLKKDHEDDVFLLNHPGKASLVLPRLKNADQFAEQWAAADYVRSSKFPEDLKYPTIIPGLFVRSKAEGDIVMRLAAYHVPFRYEAENIINGIVLHPDFTCLNARTREIFFIEHQGMWDNPKYVKDLRRREDLYLSAGIYPWVNLLITTETLNHPFDIKWFDKIIEFFLL